MAQNVTRQTGQETNQGGRQLGEGTKQDTQGKDYKITGNVLEFQNNETESNT